MLKIQRRRRREGKTDYRGRLGLLKSKKNRLIVRVTNRYIIAQIVETDIAQDKVLVGITSKILLEKGIEEKYKGSLKNITASYLTGYFLGELALKKKLSSAVLDVGLNRNIHKSRIYAVLKGAIDSGMKIPHSEKSLPDKEKINGNEKFKPILTKIKKK